MATIKDRFREKFSRTIEGGRYLINDPLEIESFLSQELENIFLEMEKVIGEDENSYIDNWGDYHNVPTDEQRNKNNLRQSQRQQLSNLKQEYLGKGKEC